MSAAFLKLVLFRIEPYSYNAQIHTFLSRRFMHSHVTHNAYRQKKYIHIQMYRLLIYMQYNTTVLPHDRLSAVPPPQTCIVVTYV
jgi:hypothetical protein